MQKGPVGTDAGPKERERNPSEAAKGLSGENLYEALLWTSRSRVRDTCKVNRACGRNEVSNQSQGR